MEYSEGYLAFIDILGFSEYVKDESNGIKTEKLFNFVNNFCDLFNTNPELEITASFFSDTIVLTSTSLTNLTIPIRTIEVFLLKELNLLFRGSVVKGKYYHIHGTTFGPAVVEAYLLEKKAKYSRIIIDKSIDSISSEDILFYKDIDGYYCYNPYALILFEINDIVNENNIPKAEILNEVKKCFLKNKVDLLNIICHYINTEYIDKYIWRIAIFNDICDSFIATPNSVEIFKPLHLTMSDELRNIFSDLRITKKDIDFIVKN